MGITEKISGAIASYSLTTGNKTTASARYSSTKVVLVLVMVLWGGSFIASKVGLDTLYPVEMATLRFAIATPVLLLITILLNGVKSLRVKGKDLPVLIVMAMTGVTLQYIVQFVAMTYTSVTNTALLINMGTFFVIIPSVLLLKVKFTADNTLGVIIAFAGAVLVATNGNIALSVNLIGDGLVLICAIFWATYVLTGNKLAGKYSVLTQLNYIFIIGFLGLLPFYFLTPHHDIASLGTVSWASLLYLAIIGDPGNTIDSQLWGTVYSKFYEPLPTDTSAAVHVWTAEAACVMGDMKAFNQITASKMLDPEHANMDMLRIAGDDEDAKRQVVDLAESFGWKVRDLGPLSKARALEHGVVRSTA
jgi:drug/metabolite transporter (DMT)-like permease